MSVLLQNTGKPARRRPDGGASPVRDVGALEVCFGGFSPMALSDGIASREQVLQAEQRVRAYQAACERAAALEAARASEVRAWADGRGTLWRYAVLDGTEVRIEGCEPAVACVAVPDAIEGKPVVALASDALAYLPDVEEIVCPDALALVGPSAFRENKSLRRVVLPRELAAFDSAWFRNCPHIEHLALSGQLSRLDASIFDLPGLRSLTVGPGTAEVAPGAFAKSALESIEVDAGNPFLMTDGAALYTRDGSVLVALAVPAASYAIRPGCRAVARKGFSTFSCVERIDAPEGLEELDAFAFSRTGIARFDAPASLRRIGEKAFFNCAALECVQMREGVASIGDNAFTGTRLRALELPSTVEELGNPLAAGCALTYAGADATFRIAEGTPASPAHLKLDSAGGLYREGADGAHLIRLMDPAARSYEVRRGTVAIEAGACANHAQLAEVALPEGLERIGRAAFKACHALMRADLPASLRRIEDEAFLDTSLARLRLPAALEQVGENALVTHGAHHGTAAPSLREVQVDAGNLRFFTSGSLLLERTDRGSARVLLCMGTEEAVRIPAEVDEIAPYAFNDVGGVRELFLSDRIARVGIRGLGIDGLLERIHVDLVKPIAGHESFDICFPDTDRGAQQMMLALSVPDRVDVAVLFEHYDNAIVNASSFDAQSSRGLGLYEQAVRIVARLQDPVFLTPVNRSLCERILRDGIADICVAVAKHDDRKTIDALVDLGFLNADNLYEAIDRIGEVQDAAMTGYLLELKRLRFGRSARDFDL